MFNIHELELYVRQRTVGRLVMARESVARFRDISGNGSFVYEKVWEYVVEFPGETEDEYPTWETRFYREGNSYLKRFWLEYSGFYDSWVIMTFDARKLKNGDTWDAIYVNELLNEDDPMRHKEAKDEFMHVIRQRGYRV